MLAGAGEELGIRCRVLDPSPDAPAGRLAELIVGAYDDRDALGRLADGADVLTYEFENVPVEAARWVGELVRVEPAARALEVAQDRLAEKTMFENIGLAVPAFVSVDSVGELVRGLASIGVPAVLKTRRLGYDGKGQVVIRDALLAEDAWRSVGEVPCILEAFVGFERELSIIAARSTTGETVFYPLVENHHREGILRLTRAPAPGITDELRSAAESHASALMTELGYVGVLAIELFQTQEGLLGNEFAPRVHNSGHWSIEGAKTSQFENHLRAIVGMPLGPAAAVGSCAMLNIVGTTPDPAAIAAVPGAYLHLYGKEPRPGRKLGHVTILAEDASGLDESIAALSAAVEER